MNIAKVLPLVGLMALAACATPGNYTYYQVRCERQDDSVRQIMTATADAISASIDRKAQTSGDNKRFLIVDIDPRPKRPNSLYIRLYWPMAYPWWSSDTDYAEGPGYTIMLNRPHNSAEDKEILDTRSAVESAVRGSQCPNFNSKIFYSLPDKWPA